MTDVVERARAALEGVTETGLAAQRLGRKYIGIDLNREYLDLSLRTRLSDAALDFESEGA